ncbi:hypothetical protein T03_13705 [Trichinella britovi]|uniref:Uncharacterized protein n=1 Tax=Trichinella britovi TaxID=45882 RepID=A0A0V1CDT6_TRIBR|nr:hypothetical protein T03_13705 [Trichinella britovi]
MIIFPTNLGKLYAGHWLRECVRETIPCEQSESRLRESKIQSTKIERLLSFPVSLGKVVIATFSILIYVVRRSERRHSVMVSDYYSMKSTVERGSNVLCITVEQPYSANFAMKLMKILMLKCLLFKRYRSFKSPLAVITNTQSRWLLFHSCCYVFNAVLLLR